MNNILILNNYVRLHFPSCNTTTRRHFDSLPSSRAVTSGVSISHHATQQHDAIMFLPLAVVLCVTEDDTVEVLESLHAAGMTSGHHAIFLIKIASNLPLDVQGMLPGNAIVPTLHNASAALTEALHAVFVLRAGVQQRNFAVAKVSLPSSHSWNCRYSWYDHISSTPTSLVCPVLIELYYSKFAMDHYLGWYYICRHGYHTKTKNGEDMFIS